MNKQHTPRMLTVALAAAIGALGYGNATAQVSFASDSVDDFSALTSGGTRNTTATTSSSFSSPSLNLFNASTGVLTGATVGFTASPTQTLSLTGTKTASANATVTAIGSSIWTLSGTGLTSTSVTNSSTALNCSANSMAPCSATTGSTTPLVSLNATVANGSLNSYVSGATPNPVTVTRELSATGTSDNDKFTSKATLSAGNLGSTSIAPTFTYVNHAQATFASGVTAGVSVIGSGTSRTIDFGAIIPPNSSPAQTFTFTNTDIETSRLQAALKLVSVDVSNTGADASLFSLTGGMVTNAFLAEGETSNAWSLMVGPASGPLRTINQTYTFNFVDMYAGGASDTLLTKSFTVNVVAVVPEPETYAMMLAGLGLFAAIARRRTKAKNLREAVTG